MRKLSQEQIGELMVFGELIAFAFFPIIIAYSTKILPPMLFAGLSILTSTVTIFFYLLFRGHLPKIKAPKVIKYSLLVALFITIIPSIFIFIGSSKTSAINTSILLQVEIIATLLIYGIFKIEKITSRKIIGAIIVTIGTLFILYNGQFQVNIGDLLIIAGVFFYPFGNYFAKKLLKITTPSIILFIRSFVGGTTLVLLSLLFEDHTNTANQITQNWPLILVNGIIVYHFSKVLWYEALKRIDVSKAIPISLGGSPAISLLLAIIFLGEIPTTYQLIGFAAVITGVLTLTCRGKRTNIAETYER
jgi:drug/metabolite transporter (DMT)-like permease